MDNQEANNTTDSFGEIGTFDLEQYPSRIKSLIKEDFEPLIPSEEKTTELINQGKTIVYRYVTLEELAYLLEKGEITTRELGKPLGTDNELVTDLNKNTPVLFGYAPQCWLTPQHDMIRLEIDVTDNVIGSGLAHYTGYDRYADDINPIESTYPEVYFTAYSIEQIVSLGFDEDPYPEADYYLDTIEKISLLGLFLPQDNSIKYPPGKRKDKERLIYEKTKREYFKKFGLMGIGDYFNGVETEITADSIKENRMRGDTILTNEIDSYRLAVFALLKIYVKRYLPDQLD